MLFLPKMKKGLPEGTGPPEWTQQPQISVSLQEGGVGVLCISSVAFKNGREKLFFFNRQNLFLITKVQLINREKFENLDKKFQ